MSDEINRIVQPGDVRDKLVATAVKFLTNPDVLRLTSASKEQFLRSKGLTDAEVAAALAKAADSLNFQSFSSDFMLYQNRRGSWVRDNVLPLVVYGGFAFGVYWFYKNCLRQLLFVEQPKKTTEECLTEVTSSLERLTASVEALRREVSESQRSGAVRSQLDAIKSEVASVKGILLSRNSFPAVARATPPSIPAWQRRGEEASSSTVAPPDESPARHSRRSESGGSNDSEGERAAKNSDSSLEIM